MSKKDKKAQDLKITESDITKAMGDLAINPTPDVSKGEKGDDEKDAKTNAKVEGEDTDTYEKKKGYKGVFSKGGKNFTKGDDGEYAEVSDEDMDGMKKKKKEKNIEKSEKGSALSTSKKDESLDSLQKAMDIAMERNEVIAKSTSTLMKGLFEKLEDMSGEIASLKLEPNERKTLAKAVARDFDGNGQEGRSSEKVLSITNDKEAIKEVMDGISFSKGYDESMGNAMLRFDADGHMPPAIAIKIEKESGFKIVK